MHLDEIIIIVTVGVVVTVAFVVIKDRAARQFIIGIGRLFFLSLKVMMNYFPNRLQLLLLSRVSVGIGVVYRLQTVGLILLAV